MVDPLGYIEGVSMCPIWGCGVFVGVVICSSFSCLTEYGAIDRVVGSVCSVVLCFYHLAEICM
jgi:hypothetical protein